MKNMWSKQNVKYTPVFFLVFLVFLGLTSLASTDSFDCVRLCQRKSIDYAMNANHALSALITLVTTSCPYSLTPRAELMNAGKDETWILTL